MVSQTIMIGIAVGVFFAGLGVGYAVFQSYNQPNFTMMTTLQMQQMMNNPQMMTQWHQTMMNDPQAMNSWMNTMMQNPQLMNTWIGSMMNDPQLRDQMYSQMKQNNQFMQGMMGQGMMGSGIQSTVDTNLARFDELDFEAFSKQNWELFNEIHAPDILVVFPDGRQTKGIEQHDKDIMAMFDYAPDTKVTSHPIKFGSGEWTVSTGVLEGTFSQPMPLADGTSIPPTGKSFKVTMTTVAKWKDGRIVEEHLFWDNAEIMKQMGLGQ